MTDAAATGPPWRRSRHSGSTGGQCVEVAAGRDGAVRIRDSKDPDGPVLRFTAREWRVFLRGAKDGQFDLDADRPPPFPARRLTVRRRRTRTVGCFAAAPL